MSKQSLLMAGTQPNNCDLAKWLQLNQMAGTQPNGCDFIKVFGIKIYPGNKE